MNAPQIKDFLHSYTDGIALIAEPKCKYQLGELVILTNPKEGSSWGEFSTATFELGEISSIQEHLVRITILGDESRIVAGNEVIRLPHYYHESRWVVSGGLSTTSSRGLFSNLTLLMTDINLYSVMDPLGRTLKELNAGWEATSQRHFLPRSTLRHLLGLVLTPTYLRSRAPRFGRGTFSLGKGGLASAAPTLPIQGQGGQLAPLRQQYKRPILEMDPFFLLPETNFLVKVELKHVNAVLRRPVDRPIFTGMKVLDTLVPIGRGQRELIIGDRATGKTSVALDVMQAQGLLGESNTDSPVSIYVGVGQKASSILQSWEAARRYAFKKYIFVIAPASYSAALQYIAPSVGCTLGEWYRDLGYASLVLYDDLSQHAVAYRQMSLLLRRSPGREAYPGDVFYLHSRLLERAANVIYTAGSLTALPVVETQTGDVSAFIPTNVISITDGQIYLDSELFYNGVMPAVDVGLSVSRVGARAQHPLIKEVSGSIKLELAVYREVEIFTKFSAELDDEIVRTIKRGQLLIQVLLQKRFSAMQCYEEFLFVYCGVNGYLNAVPKHLISSVEQHLLKR